ncbi:MAG TPA: hypothetical protein IAC04_05610 [Candidatus Coprenecus stercoravium]|uniref:Uncharacterized protein n=1 Tax=Candidatus Coprenecus stercoravium TaxID=2840735 RepID=A0A9D2GPS1_9BACT|nr:hypothetical protein [Candidatus Coprenecus stercoravium]
MNEEYEKCFHEHITGSFHKTLKAAKAAVSVAGKYPQVYRCWRKDGMIVGEKVLWAYGEYCCSIRDADKYIAEKLKES